MRNPLRCPNNHEWDPARDFTAGQVTGAACPTCGKPPLLDAIEFWERGLVWGCFVLAGGITRALVGVAASVYLVGPQWQKTINFVLAFVIVLLMVLFGRILPEWSRQKKLKAVAQGLNMTHSPALSWQSREPIAILTLVDNPPASGCLAGSYRDTSVVMMDVS